MGAKAVLAGRKIGGYKNQTHEDCSVWYQYTAASHWPLT